MSLTRRPMSPWRHPALAPVYGGLVAFGVVLLVDGLIASGPGPDERSPESPLSTTSETAPAPLDPPQVTVHIVFAGDQVPPQDTAIAVGSDRRIIAVAPDDAGVWTGHVQTDGGPVCLSPPDGWAVTEPARPGGPSGEPGPTTRPGTADESDAPSCHVDIDTPKAILFLLEPLP